MAYQLKNLYNDQFFDELCNVMEKCVPGFNKKKFMLLVKDAEWEQSELKRRMRKITLALHKTLPPHFKTGSGYIVAITKEYINRKGEGLNFLQMFLPEYIELFGLHDMKTSIKSFEEITKFASCEFAVRPFIIQYEKEMMQHMLLWSTHNNQYVRRLSSEGCRPRLPWAIALPAFKKEPSPILPILENLKNDSSETVRKSVANNLNDISKDNPHIVLEIIKRWKGISENTNWIIRHASRTLLKKGDAKALKTFDIKTSHKSEVKNLKLSKKKLKIGESVAFNFDFKNVEQKKVKFRIEYAVFYVKANKTHSKKVFQLKEGEFTSQKIVSFKKLHHLRDLTTRKHYPGEHFIVILVNGKEVLKEKFTLT
ncbi:MAG: DNA alkylation repair protein [Fimbriimonadaceae bacterium]|nr:DNA alkylation repair protein [Chitinophagales bacterium]